MINTLLIANRGEIACRIEKTARRIGLRTVAVYSEADQGALHVERCDAARLIGPPPAVDSYLNIDALIEAAELSGANAIHPGYGFLSESPDFALACEKAGIIFVGPSVSAMRMMGSKAKSKDIMEIAGVPLVPGYHGEEQSFDKLAAEAAIIGFPLLIKASAGGGGRGMRIVQNANELEEKVVSARREARNTFGDERILIEKYIQRPRHVEVQVFGDGYGDVVHLFERDCSVQRRHQKILEEAPAPNIDESVRNSIRDTAVNAARAIGYIGAGTVEFILDETEFYFIEMNTRLQVEHPVTELITGIDLVEWQIKIADGAPLPLTQNKILAKGHAFEARLYAEDPVEFRPQTGMIEHLNLPWELARIDIGINEGESVSVHYDPMLAKIIVHGRDRNDALDRLIDALSKVEVGGVITNQPFLKRLAKLDAFRSIDVHTGFINDHKLSLFPSVEMLSNEVLGMAAIIAGNQNKTRFQNFLPEENLFDAWTNNCGWRANGPAIHKVGFSVSGEIHAFTLSESDGQYQIFRTDFPMGVSGSLTCNHQNYGSVTINLSDEIVTSNFSISQDSATIYLPEGPLEIDSVDLSHRTGAVIDVSARLTAPMPGKIVAIQVSEGDFVSRGTPLIVLEAMKMEHNISAPADGRVVALFFKHGDLVDEGVELLGFELASENV